MTAVNFCLSVILGRLITWLLQTNGLSKPLWASHPVLTELGECDLCLGFWVYLAMATITKLTMFEIWPRWFDYIAQAAINAFIAHLIRLGWHSKFSTTVI